MHRQRKPIRVQRVGQDFQTVDEAWPRSIEIGIAVSDINSAVAHGHEFRPIFQGFQYWKVLQRALQWKPAASDENDVGVEVAQFVPRKALRGRTRGTDD